MTDKKSTNKKISWAALGLLIKSAKEGTKDYEEQRIVMALSGAFNIPPQGINILNGKPYINSVGLEYKLSQHPTAFKFTGYNIVKPYVQAGDIALVVVSGLDKTGGVRTALGTASAQNMNMIKGYPNELAETRAKNRILRRVLTPYLFNDFVDSVSEMGDEKKAELLKIVDDSNFGSVSSEEMGAPDSASIPKETLISEEDMKGIAEMLSGVASIKTQEDLDSVRSMIKEKVDSKEINDIQRQRLLEAYQSKQKENKLV